MLLVSPKKIVFQFKLISPAVAGDRGLLRPPSADRRELQAGCCWELNELVVGRIRGTPDEVWTGWAYITKLVEKRWGSQIDVFFLFSK